MTDQCMVNVGANLAPDGSCSFKVWAPNAEKVYVVRESNNWEMRESDKLEPGYGGYWCNSIPNVKEGEGYRFLIVKDGNYHYVLDPASHDTSNKNGSWPETIDRPTPDYIFDKTKDNVSLVVDPNYPWVDFTKHEFSDFLIYQFHVGSFAGLNDEHQADVDKNDKVATFRQVATKLGYISGMEFNAIELLPVQEFNGEKSWGYNPALYFTPEQKYGPPKELKHLINEAHRHGLAVIFDIVFTHLLWGSDDGYNSSVNPFINFDNSGQEIYMDDKLVKYEWAGRSRILAFWKEQVIDYVIDNLKILFDEYKIDGFRFDMTPAIQQQGQVEWDNFKRIISRIKQLYPSKYLIAEHLPNDGRSHDIIISEAKFDATWFSEAHGSVKRALNHEFNWTGDPVDLLCNNVIGKDFGWQHNYPNQWNLIKYLGGSHDECGDVGSGKHKEGNWEKGYFHHNFGDRYLGYGQAKTRMAWALNISIMGTPMLFAGTEVLHEGWFTESLDNLGDHRFNWEFTRDVVGQQMRDLVTDANRLRKQNPGLRGDELDICHKDYKNRVVGFKRWIKGWNNCLLVIVNMGNTNFGDHSYGVKTGSYGAQNGQWTQILCTQDAKYGGWHGAGNAYYEPSTASDGKVYINLPSYSVIMMKLK